MDRTVRQVSAAIGSSEIDAQPGIADFGQQRFLYDEGGAELASLTLFAPGEEYSCGPDEWERVGGDPLVLGRSERAWMLALIAGVVGAQREDREKLLGQQSTRYAVTVSFTEAAARCERTLEPPRTSGGIDLDCLPCQVWLDTERRILKAALRLGESSMIIELSNLGAPGPVQLPEPGSFWSAEDEPSQ
jgi:hypothetical protein